MVDVTIRICTIEYIWICLVFIYCIDRPMFLLMENSKLINECFLLFDLTECNWGVV